MMVYWLRGFEKNAKPLNAEALRRRGAQKEAKISWFLIGFWRCLNRWK